MPGDPTSGLALWIRNTWILLEKTGDNERRIIGSTGICDRARRGQSATPFPKQPVELWRRELAGGLELPPVIDSHGEIVAALVSPDLVRIGRDGRQQWRTRLGAAPAVVPSVLTM